MSIKYRSLNDIAKVSAGGTPKRSVPLYWKNGDIPWVKIKDIKNKYVSEVEEYITNEGLKNSSAKLFPKGTILYTIFATLGECAILDIDATTNQAIAGINVTSDEVLTDYLYYYLKFIKSMVISKGRGVAQNNINLKILRNLTIPIPSMDIQKRVINIIKTNESILLKRQQQIEALSALKQSVYYGMLNSFKKEKFKLKDILKIDTVTMKDFTENPEYYLIGIDNIEKDTGRIINHKKITETSVKGSKHYFNEKHVLYSKIRPYLNKVATPTFEGVCSTDCYPLLVDETKATKEFVVLLLRSQEFVSYANSQSTGANIPRINQTKLLNYNFLMPNLEIQHRIKEKVNKIDQSILLMENSLEQINLLYDSILHKAFNGELFKENIIV